MGDRAYLSVSFPSIRKYDANRLIHLIVGQLPSGESFNVHYSDPIVADAEHMMSAPQFNPTVGKEPIESEPSTVDLSKEIVRAPLRYNGVTVGLAHVNLRTGVASLFIHDDRMLKYFEENNEFSMGSDVDPNG